ncbi:putative glycine-rich RNA-binding protein [Iris pallida]|uniref:Glycine-rich RNA-binding protein n=1 Tax=Iris pallida TaxID=29817 RepID=A0AAX6GHN2_IRIPA|nr:putative glycine-rich RNA-binding protein [Iris pallida]
MAFSSKFGSLLKKATTSSSSLYKLIRCMSSSKVFIGGLSYGTDELLLREAFTKYGEVVEARVIMDRETGRSKGFGFVTFTSEEHASSAITAMDGKDLHGRMVRVNYATDRNRGYGGGYGGGGGGDGGAGGYGGGSRNYGDSYNSGGGGYGGSSGGYSGGSGNYGDSYNSAGGGYGGNSGGYSGGSDGNYSVAGGSGDGYAHGGAGGNFASSGSFGSNAADQSGGYGGVSN